MGIAHICLLCRFYLLDLFQGAVVLPTGPCSYHTAATARLLMTELVRSVCTVGVGEHDGGVLGPGGELHYALARTTLTIESS